jgi:hypothetical protein
MAAPGINEAEVLNLRSSEVTELRTTDMTGPIQISNGSGLNTRSGLG